MRTIDSCVSPAASRSSIKQSPGQLECLAEVIIATLTFPVERAKAESVKIRAGRPFCRGLSLNGNSTKWTAKRSKVTEGLVVLRAEPFRHRLSKHRLKCFVVVKRVGFMLRDDDLAVAHSKHHAVSGLE